MGHRVIFITSSKFDWMYSEEDLNAISRFADHIQRIDDTQNADCLDRALTALREGESVDAVLTVLQWCVQPLAEAANRHGLLFTHPRGVNNARNKGHCREILQAVGLPSVKYAVVSSRESALQAAKTIGYPLIVKPTTGVAKILTRIVNEEIELQQYFDCVDAECAVLNDVNKNEVYGDLILEELAIGPLYSIELGATAHGEWIPFVTMKRKLGHDNRILEMGSTLPSDLTIEEHDKATAYAIDVAKALDLDIGIFHVEFIYTANGPRLVEVNPRLGGGAVASLIKTATGENIFSHLINIHLGNRIGISSLRFKTAASHTFIAAADHCIVRADLPKEWFDLFRQRLSAGSIAISAGDSLSKMTGNLDVKGFIQVTANDHETAIRNVNLRLQELEGILGIRLMQCDSLLCHDSLQ